MPSNLRHTACSISAKSKMQPANLTSFTSKLGLTAVAMILSVLVIGSTSAQEVSSNRSLDKWQRRIVELEREVADLRSEIASLKEALKIESQATQNAEIAEGPAALLEAFLAPDADLAALSQDLRPTREDYDQLFTKEFAEAAFQTYDPAWQQGQIVLRPKTGQTKLVLDHLNAEDLRQWNEKADNVPGGYKSVAKYMVGDFQIYSFKFVQPDKDFGMSWTGLIQVNGQWRLFPKLWRVPME